MTVGPFTLLPSVDDERTVISGFWSRRLGLSVDWARTRGVPQGRASAHNNAATAPTERIHTAPPPASPCAVGQSSKAGLKTRRHVRTTKAGLMRRRCVRTRHARCESREQLSVPDFPGIGVVLFPPRDLTRLP